MCWPNETGFTKATKTPCTRKSCKILSVSAIVRGSTFSKTQMNILRKNEAFVIQCVRGNRINELVHGARDGRVSIDSLNALVKTEKRGLDSLRALLRVETRGGQGALRLRKTTLMHELCRSASRALLRWLFIHAARNGEDMSLFCELREQHGSDTPLHELAKRLPPEPTEADRLDNDTWDALMRDIFARHSSDEALNAQNKDGATPLHFLALLNEDLSEDIKRRNKAQPQKSSRRRERAATSGSLAQRHVRMLDNGDALSADALRAERLGSELRSVKSQNKQLRQQAESAQAAHDDIEAQQERLREQMVAQQRRINELGDQLGIERDKAYQLTLQEAAELDHNRATAKELERITLERDAARAEAKRTSEELAKVSAERRAALEKQEELEEDVEALRVNASMNSVTVQQKEDERDKLAARIAELEQARRDAEDEAERARNANELTATQEERAQEDSLRRAQQLSALNDELARVEEQCDTAELERVAAVEKLRTAEVELEEREKALAEMEARFQKATQQSQRVQDDLADSQRRAAKLAEKVHALAEERDALRKKQQEAEQARERIEREIGAENEQLRARLGQSEELLQRAREEAAREASEAQEALNAAKDETERAALKKALAERAAALDKQLEEMRSIDAQMHEMQEQARAAAEKSKQERERLSQDLKAARKQAAEAAAIAEENRLCAEQWSATYERETDALRKDAEKKHELYERARRELSEFRENNSELQRGVDEREAEIARLKAEMERTTNVYRAMAEKAATGVSGAAAGSLSPRKRSGSLSRGLLRRSSTLKKASKAGVPQLCITGPLGADGEELLSPGRDHAEDSAEDSANLPRSCAGTPRLRAQSHSLAKLRVDPEREKRLGTMEANLRRNQLLWTTVTKAVVSGDITTLRSAFHLGLSPNTIDPGTHRVLLEVCVRACSQAYKALGHKHGNEATLQLVKLQKVLNFLIENGAEWSDIDRAVEEGYADGTMPLAEETRDIISQRDDHSPFVRALIENDAMRFAELIDSVSDIDRVPRPRDKRLEGQGFSFLHIAVLNAQTPKGTWRGHKNGVVPLAGSDSMVYNLVRRGASCVTTDAMERTPLHLALMNANNTERETLLRVVEYLMAGGADPEEICPSKEYQIVASDGAIKKSVLKKVSSRKESEADKHSRRQQNAQRYGTALAYAQVRQDKRLLELMQNRRYRRVPLETLSEYVKHSVHFACIRKSLSGQKVADKAQGNDPFEVICERYSNTFQFFNPRFAELRGTERTHAVLQEAAGVTENDTDDEIESKITVQLERDTFFVRSVLYELSARQIPDPEDAVKHRLGFVPEFDERQRAYLEAIEPADRAQMNKSHLWRACDMIEKCIQALSSKWFDVSNIVHEPAQSLYGTAALDALHEFIKRDELEAMLEMISRKDALYGDITLNTIVYEEKKYQCVDLAANYGATRCLRALLERQPERALQPGPSFRTLVNVAVQAEQPITIVLIDKFAFEHSLSSERHPNAGSYAILRKPSQDSVLHSCVTRDPPAADLLRWAIEHVQFHIDSTNAQGDTPLRCAKRRERNLSEDEPLVARAVRVCISTLENRAPLDSSGTSASNTATEEQITAAITSGGGSSGGTSATVTPRATGRGSRNEPYCETVYTPMNIGDSDSGEEDSLAFQAATLSKPPPLSLPPSLKQGDQDPEDAIEAPTPRSNRTPVGSGADDSDGSDSESLTEQTGEPETPRTRERRRHRKKSSRSHRSKGDGTGKEKKKHKSKRSKSKAVET